MVAVGAVKIVRLGCAVGGVGVSGVGRRRRRLGRGKRCGRYVCCYRRIR